MWWGSWQGVSIDQSIVQFEVSWLFMVIILCTDLAWLGVSTDEGRPWCVDLGYSLQWQFQALWDGICVCWWLASCLTPAQTGSQFDCWTARSEARQWQGTRDLFGREHWESTDTRWMRDLVTVTENSCQECSSHSWGFVEGGWWRMHSQEQCEESLPCELLTRVGHHKRVGARVAVTLLAIDWDLPLGDWAWMHRCLAWGLALVTVSSESERRTSWSFVSHVCFPEETSRHGKNCIWSEDTGGRWVSFQQWCQLERVSRRCRGGNWSKGTWAEGKSGEHISICWCRPCQWCCNSSFTHRCHIVCLQCTDCLVQQVAEHGGVSNIWQWVCCTADLQRVDCCFVIRASEFWSTDWRSNECILWQLRSGQECEHARVCPAEEAQCNQLPCSVRGSSSRNLMSQKGRWEYELGRLTCKSCDWKEVMGLMLEFVLVNCWLACGSLGWGMHLWLVPMCAASWTGIASG